MQDASPKSALSDPPACLVTGFHHVALVTDDLKAVTEFYAGLLGFKIIRAMRLPPGWGTGPMNLGKSAIRRNSILFLRTRARLRSVFL